MPQKVIAYKMASASHFGLVKERRGLRLRNVLKSVMLVLLLCLLRIGIAMDLPESLPWRRMGMAPKVPAGTGASSVSSVARGPEDMSSLRWKTTTT